MADPIDTITDYEQRLELARLRAVTTNKYLLYTLLYRGQDGSVRVEGQIGSDCDDRQTELGITDPTMRAVGHRLEGGGVHIDTENDDLRTLLEEHFRLKKA